MVSRPTPSSIDSYISTFSPDVQQILQRIRSNICEAAPEAEEVISYKMPAFRNHGIIVYFAAFAHHIGLYPPVLGDPALQRALAPYAGVKGNLRFPLDKPIPYPLIRRIVRLRVKQNLANQAAQRAKGQSRTKGKRGT